MITNLISSAAVQSAQNNNKPEGLSDETKEFINSAIESIFDFDEEENSDIDDESAEEQDEEEIVQEDEQGNFFTRFLSQLLVNLLADKAEEKLDEINEKLEG